MNSPLKIDTLGTMMPWLSEEDRKLRQRLLSFQQRAGTRARQCQDDRARAQWWLACDLAQEMVFAPAPEGHIEERLRTITRIALTAGAMERWSAGQ